MSEYILGTQDGVRRLREVNGVWDADTKTALQGKQILCAAKLDGRILATSYGDGVYISRDSGKSWTAGDDNRLRKVRCLRRAVWNGQDVVFAGVEPLALYVSYDGGDTWNELSEVRKLQEVRKWTYPVVGVDPHVRDVVVDALDGDSLYVAIQVGGILIGRQKGTQWQERGEGLNLDVHRTLFEPSNRLTLYACTGEEGIFVSQDGGEKWHRCGLDFPWTYAIPFETWGPRRLVAGMGKGLPGDWMGRESGAEAVLAVSKDGGETWKATYPGKPLNSMIMDMIFTSSERTSMLVATGAPIGRSPEATGAIYHVDLDGGRWNLLTEGLAGISVIVAYN